MKDCMRKQLFSSHPSRLVVYVELKNNIKKKSNTKKSNIAG